MRMPDDFNAFGADYLHKGLGSTQSVAALAFAAYALMTVVGRLIVDRLGPLIKQTVVVENRPGAGGTLGTASVARSAPPTSWRRRPRSSPRSPRPPRTTCIGRTWR